MKKLYFNLTLFFTLCCSNLSFSQIEISEICHTNMAVVADSEGDNDDWFEIRNNSLSPFDIGGFGISNELNKPYKWTCPTYLMAPGEHKMIWASGNTCITF